MSAILSLAAYGAAAFAVAAAPAPADAPGNAPGHVVVEPRLLLPPSEAELAQLYPVRANAHGLNGRSTMQCRVRRNTTLADCRLVGEAPDQAGFGRAILESAQSWRLQPRRVDGRAVDDGQVRLTVQWVALP